MTTNQKVRVLLAKPGLDGHDRGVKVVARALRDSGMEVIYTGLHKSPDQIVEAALQEDVDVIGISCMCNEHITFMPEVTRLLYEDKDHERMGRPLLLVGGVIPKDDIAFLKSLGVDAVFPAGSMVEEVIDYIREELPKRSTPE